MKCSGLRSARVQFAVDCSVVILKGGLNVLGSVRNVWRWRLLSLAGSFFSTPSNNVNRSVMSGSDVLEINDIFSVYKDTISTICWYRNTTMQVYPCLKSRISTSALLYLTIISSYEGKCFDNFCSRDEATHLMEVPYLCNDKLRNDLTISASFVAGLRL